MRLRIEEWLLRGIAVSFMFLLLGGLFSLMQGKLFWLSLLAMCMGLVLFALLFASFESLILYLQLPTFHRALRIATYTKIGVNVFAGLGLIFPIDLSSPKWYEGVFLEFTMIKIIKQWLFQSGFNLTEILAYPWLSVFSNSLFLTIFMGLGSAVTILGLMVFYVPILWFIPAKKS